MWNYRFKSPHFLHFNIQHLSDGRCYMTLSNIETWNFKMQISCIDSCPVMVVYVLNRMKFLAGHTKVNCLTFLVIINENIQPFLNCVPSVHGYSLHNKSPTHWTLKGILRKLTVMSWNNIQSCMMLELKRVFLQLIDTQTYVLT